MLIDTDSEESRPGSIPTSGEASGTSTMLEAALDYAAKGFKVFALAPKTKVPPKNSNGFYDATSDPEKVRAMWEENPDANIGIATGHGGVFVVDIDPEKGGRISIEKLRPAAGWPRSLFSKTGSGGMHFFFRSSTPVRSAQNILPGIDVRGIGGYVVAPPSVHPSGRVYEWATTEEIAEAPQSLVDFVVSKEKQKKPSGRVTEGETIPVGQRDDTLFRCAAGMRGRGMSEEEIFDVLLKMNRRCEEPLPERDLRRIASSSATRYKPNDYSYALPPGKTVVEGREREPGEDDDVETPRPTLVPVSTIKAEPIAWRWTGRMEAGEVSTLEGLPSAGKSTLGTEIAAAVSTGRALYGDTARPAQGVIWISHEESPSKTLRPRLEAAGADLERVYICEAKFVPKFPDDYGWLIEQIKTLDVGVVFIDPIDSYLDFGRNGDSNRNTDVRSRLQGLAGVAHETGASIILVRHWRKAGNVAALYRSTGSIGYTAVARTIISVVKDPEDESRRVVSWAKMNDAVEPSSLVFKIGEGRKVEWIGEDQRTAQEIMDAVDSGEKKDSALAEASDFLRTYLANGKVESMKMKAAAESAGISGRTLERARKALNVHTAKGEGGVWWSELPPSMSVGF
jgi:hypothetical protein